MPPPAKKDCGLILFDVHSSKKQSLLDGLLKISVYKWLSLSKDLYRLVLTHTKITNNELNLPNINVTEVEDLKPEDVYNSVITAQSAEGNWLDDILVGIHYLKQAIGLPGLITMQLVYFTTLDKSMKPIDETKVQKIIGELKANKIYLYIIGPSVRLPSTITCAADVPEVMQQLNVDKFNVSLTVAKRIVQSTKTGVLCDLSVGVHLFHSFKDFPGSWPWLVPLSFGSQLSLPVETMKTFRKDYAFNLNRVMNPRSKSMVLADDVTTTVNFQDIVKGVLRHGKFVPVEDNRMFKVEGDRSFDVLGFTEHKFVPDMYLAGYETYFVLPSGESGDKYEMFSYLLKILSEQKKYVIARKIYFKDNRPKFYALIPQPSADQPHFLMATLPFADDISGHFVLENPKQKEKISDQRFIQFCENLDITNPKRRVSVPLGPAMQMDWFANKIINESANKMFNTTFGFSETETDPLDGNETAQFLDKLKESWPQASDNDSQ